MRHRALILTRHCQCMWPSIPGSRATCKAEHALLHDCPALPCTAVLGLDTMMLELVCSLQRVRRSESQHILCCNAEFINL